MPTSKDFTYTSAPLNSFRNVMKYSNLWKIDWTKFDCIENSAYLKQGAHIHYPTAGSLPHACAQPYHAGSGSNGLLFRPYWSPPAWRSRWVNERGKPASQKTLTAEVTHIRTEKSHKDTYAQTTDMWALFSNSSTTLPRRSAAIDTLTNSFNETSVWMEGEFGR